ncbi:MAG: hypothetical protein NT071_10560 [Burkholderiales bacterium]|nr:hypothetical protein [Burkholderiales bacterium]
MQPKSNQTWAAHAGLLKANSFGRHLQQLIKKVISKLAMTLTDRDHGKGPSERWGLCA